jgi:hypothetical protein
MSATDVRRADSRAHTMTGWLDSRRSFSFGPHYDRANTHHGLLFLSNDDRVAPGSVTPICWSPQAVSSSKAPDRSARVMLSALVGAAAPAVTAGAVGAEVLIWVTS